MNHTYIEQLNSVHVNTSQAIARFSGNSDLFEKFLNKFTQDDNYLKIQNAMQQKDYDALLSAAHTLKGVSGNLAMETLYQVCSEMVTHLRSGRTDLCEEIYQRLSQQYQAIYQVISKHSK